MNLEPHEVQKIKTLLWAEEQQTEATISHRFTKIELLKFGKTISWSDNFSCILKLERIEKIVKKNDPSFLVSAVQAANGMEDHLCHTYVAPNEHRLIV